MNPLEEVTAACPYCGETIRLLIDTTLLPSEYIEDCEVCCQPMQVSAVEAEGSVTVTCRQESDCY